MIDLNKPLAKLPSFGKWTGMPWRGILIVLGGSFFLASAVSTIMAQLFLPDATAPMLRGAAVQNNLSVPNPTASLNQASIDLIIKRNIFNSDGKTADDGLNLDEGINLPTTAEAVKSDLPVKLLGTIFGGDPFSGIAMVENATKRTVNSFLVGDTLLRDAVVKEVHREKVIIDRNGRLEYIEVAPVELARNRRSKKKTTPASINGVAPLATEPPPATYREEGFERKERDISMTEAYRNKLLTTDFTKVLQDAKATPNMVDGELKGFILNRIRTDSIYEKAGLQNDDIVEEINGVPLTDTAQAIRLLQSLRSEKEIEVRVNRGGRTQRFVLTIN